MIRSCSVFFALLISVCAFKQESDSANKETLIITLKPKFGFNLGADYSLAQNYCSTDTFGIYPSTFYNTPGFRLGVFEIK
jgi:hypothetical protein